MADEVPNDELKPIEEWTDKERLIVAKYFELSFNGTKAAIAAGYSKKSARQIASETLTKPYIRIEIDRRMAELSMGKNEVLARLAQHASGDMREFIDTPVKMLSKHPNGNLIKKFKLAVTTTFDYEGLPQIEEKIELELYDAQAALVQIGRHHKLFTDNLDHTTQGEKLGAPQVFLPAVDSDEP